jgi:hypothetical protein
MAQLYGAVKSIRLDLSNGGKVIAFPVAKASSGEEA